MPPFCKSKDDIRVDWMLEYETFKLCKLKYCINNYSRMWLGIAYNLSL